MDMAFGIEMVVGAIMLFGGGAWLWSEVEAVADRKRATGAIFALVALAIAGIGGMILWNGINGGPRLLDPDAVRKYLPDRF